jgi:hypothetical protein
MRMSKEPSRRGVRASVIKVPWRRLLRFGMDMSAWSVFLPGAVSGEMMAYWLRRQPGTGDIERPLSRAERREWAALVKQVDPPEHRP